MTKLSPNSVTLFSSNMSKEGVDKYGYTNGETQVAHAYITPASEETTSSSSCYEDSTDYGYGDAAPDTASNKQDQRDYYGYGDAVPSLDQERYQDSSKGGHFSSHHHQRMPRRSSLKTAGSSSRRSSLRGSAGEEIKVSLPFQDKPVRRLSLITFSKQVAVQPIVPASSLADGAEELWIQDHEYDRIRSKTLRLVERKERGKTGGRNYCFRGLENMLGRQDVVARKNCAWDIVLDEQEFQRNQQELDEEYMAKLYRSQTHKSKEEASRRAREDEEAIGDYLQHTRRQCRRLSM